MKAFEEQNNELVEFDKSFDSNDFLSCVNRAMLLIKNREAQAAEEGCEFSISADSCRCAIEQAIINRNYCESMMSAAIKYVELIECRLTGC